MKKKPKAKKEPAATTDLPTAETQPQPETPTDLDNELHEILFGYARDAENRLEQARTKLRDEILPALRKHRVTNIEAAYSGYGDSGAIEGLQFRDAVGRRVERTDIPGPLKEQLEEVLYEFLPEGFEINEGSQGTLTIDLQASRISVQHQENYTATSESSQEFSL